jgi:hypothetical protein
MTRFYFHLTDGTMIEDDQGQPCATEKEARAHADQVARELSRNRARDDIKHWAVCVTDESGKRITRIPLARHPRKQ